MNFFHAVIFVFGLMLAFAGRLQAKESVGYFESIKNEAPIKKGETYYMRHNLMFEKDTWDAVNYWRGVLLQINTKVKVEKLGRSSMTISWDDFSLKIINSDYTKKDMPTLVRNMLSRTPVPLEKFGSEMAGIISRGEVVEGMTREQVIMSRGYPPAHKTPTISMDNGKWIYWSSRYVTLTLVFKNGELEPVNIKRAGTASDTSAGQSDVERKYAAIKTIGIPHNINTKEAKAALIQYAANSAPENTTNWEAMVDSLLRERVPGYRGLQNAPGWFIEAAEDAAVIYGYQRDSYYMRIKMNINNDIIAPEIMTFESGGRSGRLHKNAPAWINEMLSGVRATLGRFSAIKDRLAKPPPPRSGGLYKTEA